jgi:GT2 family glycosyltransferase
MPSALTVAQTTRCAQASRLLADTDALDQVTVITVTYNSAHCIAGLATSLIGFNNVIVVDNASNDDCASLAAVFLPCATIVKLQQNLGFGSANNQGLAKVKTPFALLLNPDCEITSSSVQQLLRTAQTYPTAAIIGPQLMGVKRQLDVNYRWPHLLWNSRGPAIHHGPACVGFICGAAMLLRMQAIEPVLGQGPHAFFDQRFFLYYEDDDLCMRLFNQQKPLIIDPCSQAIHKSRGSVRGSKPLKSEYIRGYHHVQSKLIYVNKYQGACAALKLRRSLIWQTPLALLARLILPSPKHLARMWGRFIGVLYYSQV